MLKNLVAVVAVVSVFALGGCAGADSTTQQSGARGATCAYPGAGEPAKPADPPSTSDVPNTGTATATIHLTAGDVEVTLDRAVAPCTVNSFLSLTEQGYFDETNCHRLVDRGIFILQCGDPSGTGRGGPGYTIPDETVDTMTYTAGTVAMANMGGDAATGGSQFFLVWADSTLDPDYTVFGRMDQAGIDVVGGIAAQGVSAEDQTSPIAEAKITNVTLG